MSADLSYDLDPRWTLGGKLGYRMSKTSDEEGAPYVENDAWLAVASARYHLVAEWDALVEVRGPGLVQVETTDWSILAAGYRQINPNVSIGLGYNFGRFSDDLTDLVQDDEGAFVNLIAQFRTNAAALQLLRQPLFRLSFGGPRGLNCRALTRSASAGLKPQPSGA